MSPVENAILPQDQEEAQHVPDSSSAVSLKKTVAALTTSKLANQNHPKKLKMNHELSTAGDSSPMDKLLARLSEQQATIHQQNEALKTEHGGLSQRVLDQNSSSSSLPITPATEALATTAPITRPASATPNDSRTAEEVLRLKLELAQAQTKISRLDQELAQSRLLKSDSGRLTPTVSPDPNFHPIPAPDPLATRPQGAPSFDGLGKAPLGRDNSWQGPIPDDCRSDASDALSASGFNRSRAIWGNGRPGLQHNLMLPNPLPLSDSPQPAQWAPGRSHPFADQNGPFPPPLMENFRGDRFNPDHDMMMKPLGARRGNRYDSRFGPPQSFGTGYGGYNTGQGQGQYDAGHSYSESGLGAMSGGGMSMYSPFPPQPIASPLSPHATEFTSAAGSSWKNDTIATEGQTYLPTTEPLNYRRLLDRNVNCNWKYIVDKIVCNNDQQASIFLQQKLKVGTPEQKYEIVEAIVAQAYPLMVNRFGNFLVQRCFEHGTPEQVNKIAEAIRGNTLNLSMDPFGCHVVQKAFDSVPEDYKAIMVHELLRRIPETVIHRYACHVWQKLFELRWTESPPQIMKYVNEALRGMWHEVALGETGSLVVQNIFENCLEDDKRPCIEEVLANIDIVAHGQFGNWCIQHICEHGAPADRSRAIDHVIRYAAEYSMDQFASKVVEKCLKIGGTEFLSRYLDRVCEGRVDRPRIPLIDIASDQYGNYLIQYILTHAGPQHREIVAAHIRKHMVSLRGSKFGSRVGMLCTNPAVATRPGPGVGPVMSGRMPPGPRYGGAYR
ncbi:Meiotic coiled-coil protein 2 [Pleurostoma richardsiae]|uniref:Meiotic coiled-coil protein 2 n=1 Tax=Pleurostoma richardsiae TaxID=41990 RepID=A0AA38S5Y4_9PEZI|nr:Meiotic coiled-coil protein 2 [Pleurostoma richardsiae]